MKGSKFKGPGMNLFKICFVLLFSIFLGCSGGGDGTADTDEPHDLSGNLVVDSKSAASEVAGVSIDDDDTIRLTSKRNSSLGKRLRVTSVLTVVPDVDDRFPFGFSGKISKVATNSDGSVTADLEKASLADVVDSTMQEAVIGLNADNFIGVISPSATHVSEDAAGANYTRSATNYSGTKYAINGGVVVKNNTMRAGLRKGAASGEIKLGSVELNLTVKLTDMKSDDGGNDDDGTNEDAAFVIKGSLENLMLEHVVDFGLTSGLNELKAIVHGDIDIDVGLHANGEMTLGYFHKAWKDVEDVQKKLLGITGKLTGLDSKDKIGKFPLVGLVWSTNCPSTCITTLGSTKTPINLAKLGGVIVWVYLDAKGEISLEGSFGSRVNTAAFSIGIEKPEGGDLDIVYDLTNQEGVHLLELPYISGSLGINARAGVALDVDVFTLGIRLANASAEICGNYNSTIEGELNYGTNALGENWNWMGSACMTTNYGVGLILSADANVGFKVETRLFETGAAFSYHGQWPSEKDIRIPGWHGLGNLTWYTADGVYKCFYTDSDGDGVNDDEDTCPGTPAGTRVDESGCPDSSPPVKTWYKDSDEDGYSDGVMQTVSYRPAGYFQPGELIATSGDCDDNDPDIHPQAMETECDGIDQNCDGADSCNTRIWYKDADEDGYSDGSTRTGSYRPAGYFPSGELVATSGDCDDNDPYIHPEAQEIECDGIDQNCDGVDSCTARTWFKDADSDGYSDGTAQTDSNRPTGYFQPDELIATSGDCDDNDPDIHPEALEACDGVDQNCDGEIDEGCDYEIVNVIFSGSSFSCLNGSGTEVYSGSVSTTGSPYWPDDNYVIRDAKLGDVDGDGEQEIVVIANHSPYYPGQVAVFDHKCNLQGRYWNPGHLYSLALHDISGGSALEILVGATNNDRQSAFHVPAIFALSGSNVHGEAPPDYGNHPPGSELWYAFVDLNVQAGIQALGITEGKITGNTQADGNGTDYCVNFSGNTIMCYDYEITEVTYSGDRFSALNASGAEVGSGSVSTSDSPYWPGNNYVIRDAKLGDVDGDGEKEIVVIANHSPYYPGQVAVFDHECSLQGRYWNPGHLYSLALYDISGGSALEIIVGATNNDRQSGLNVPAIFALSGNNVYGEAPPDYGDHPAGSELWYAFVDLTVQAGVQALNIAEDKIAGSTQADGNGTDYCVDFSGNDIVCSDQEIVEVTYSGNSFSALNASGAQICSGSVSTGDSPYWPDNSYVIRDAKLGDVDGDGEKEIVAIANHSPYYPGQVAVFDHEGNLQGRYWNPGHLYSLALYDISGGSALEIIVGATNNDRQSGLNVPAIFALSGNNVYGEAPPDYGDHPAGSELWYAFVDLTVQAGVQALNIAEDKITGNTQADGNGTDYCVDFSGNNITCGEVTYSLGERPLYRADITSPIYTSDHYDTGNSAAAETFNNYGRPFLIYALNEAGRTISQVRVRTYLRRIDGPSWRQLQYKIYKYNFSSEQFTLIHDNTWPVSGNTPPYMDVSTNIQAYETTVICDTSVSQLTADETLLFYPVCHHYGSGEDGNEVEWELHFDTTMYPSQIEVFAGGSSTVYYLHDSYVF